MLCNNEILLFMVGVHNRGRGIPSAQWAINRTKEAWEIADMFRIPQEEAEILFARLVLADCYYDRINGTCHNNPGIEDG